MIFHPQHHTKTGGCYLVPAQVTASAHPCLNKNILKEFWHNFTFQTSTLHITEQFNEASDFVFSIGTTQPLPLKDCDYSIHIEANGICVYAQTEQNLIRGFMTLLDQIQAVDPADFTDSSLTGASFGLTDSSLTEDNHLSVETIAVLDCAQIWDRPQIPYRMVHFCIFPETELWELQRFIRFCGALKYTHIVLEFWGTLKYDCMQELAWLNAFSKDQIRPFIHEANELGLEVIPLFNHWGHASAGRSMHGKHVVLDQNPTLQTFFTEDGWCWDIRKPKVKHLLRQIREELLELCGNGSYFHIGCDEAYAFTFKKENMDFICSHINEISEEMTAHNRRILVWGDMFLYRHSHYNPKNNYTCNAPSAQAEQYMLEHLSKNVIFADWQYSAPQAPIETVSIFQKAGFDCILCPWDLGSEQIAAVLSTAHDQSLMGFLHTTWHTLSRGLPYVTLAAICGSESAALTAFPEVQTSSAALLRKVMPCGGDYHKAGWSHLQIGDCIWN